MTVFSAGGRLVTELARLGVRHIAAPLNHRSPLHLREATRRLADAMQSERPDIVHAHARIPAWAAERARHGRADPPLVTTYHGIYNAGWLWRRFSRWGDRVIAVSPEVRDHLIRSLGAPADRIAVVPNGIDVDHFRPDPERRADASGANASAADASGEDGPRILHVSRLDDVLSPAIALCAATPLLARRWPGVETTILGGGRGLEQVRSAARHANDQLGRQAVRLPGAAPDPMPQLVAADIVVAAGRAALEAMACARPVVVAGAGGLGGVVTETGWRDLAETNYSGRAAGRDPMVSTEALAGELAALLAEPEQASRLGAFGRSLVKEWYSEEAMVDAVLAVYRQTREECR